MCVCVDRCVDKQMTHVGEKWDLCLSGSFAKMMITSSVYFPVDDTILTFFIDEDSSVVLI